MKKGYTTKNKSSLYSCPATSLIQVLIIKPRSRIQATENFYGYKLHDQNYWIAELLETLLLVPITKHKRTKT